MLFACELTQDVDRAEQWLRAGDEIARRRNMAAIGAHCRSYVGGIFTMAGRWSEAEAALLEATRFFDQGMPAGRIKALVRLADLRTRQGRLEEANQLLEGLEGHTEAVGPIAALLLARGETVRARDVLERAAAGASLDPATVIMLRALLVDVLLAEGAVDEATAEAHRVVELAAHHPVPAFQGRALLAQGRVSLATGIGDARAPLLAAQAAFERAHMPLEHAHARLELARALVSDRPQVAIAEAEAALAMFEQLHASVPADAAASLLRSLGVRVRTGGRGHAALTRRETEVLALLGHGLSNPEIAERLFITRKTAEHHVGQVLGKLNLKNRAEAAAYAARIGSEQVAGAEK
jgi:DNA-binding CsgD family transcriptional regulator